MDSCDVDPMTTVSCPKCSRRWPVPLRIIDGGGIVRCPYCSTAYRRSKRVIRPDNEEFNPRPIWTPVI